jgi:hypothetical protein
MNPHLVIQEIAHDLAAIIDPVRLGVCGAREIDLGEGASRRKPWAPPASSTWPTIWPRSLIA